MSSGGPILAGAAAPISGCNVTTVGSVTSGGSSMVSFFSGFSGGAGLTFASAILVSMIFGSVDAIAGAGGEGRMTDVTASVDCRNADTAASVDCRKVADAASVDCRKAVATGPSGAVHSSG